MNKGIKTIKNAQSLIDSNFNKLGQAGNIPTILPKLDNKRESNETGNTQKAKKSRLIQTQIQSQS